MQTKIRKIILIVSLVLILAILAGMIGVTAVLSREKENEWEYVRNDQKIDYYSGSVSGTDFEYAANLKRQIVVYLGSILNDEFASFLNIYNILSYYLNDVSDRIILSMSLARIPAEKLNLISRCLQSHPISNIFGKFEQVMQEITDAEEIERKLIEVLSETSLLKLVGTGLRDFMSETTLTENEIGEFIYYYCSQNGNSGYIEYLNKMGKNYFVKMISCTVYVLSSLNGENPFGRLGNETLYYMIQTVLYELGDLYAGIKRLPGEIDTFEHVFQLTWDYGDAYENGLQLSELARSIKGRIGTLFCVMGYFMQNISVDDITAMYEYENASEEYKDEKRIAEAILLSGAIKRSYRISAEELDLEEKSAADFFVKYAEVDETLEQISTILGNRDEEDPEEEWIDPFVTFSDSLRFFDEKDLTIEEISMMDKESDAYTEIVGKARGMNAIDGGLSTIFGHLINIWVLNETEKTATEGE